MGSILNSFHVEFGLFIAQIINFTIVFVVLYYFVIKPITKIMKERSEKIAESIKQAEDIKKELVKTENDYNKQIKKARQEAKIIVAEASERAIKTKEETVAKAKAEIGEIINKEKESIRMEKDKVMKEIKKEVADLIIIALGKVLEKKVDSKEDTDLIRKIINS